MTEATSIESYRACIDAGLISDRQQAVIRYMAERHYRSVTQGEINRHFQDTNRSYAPRFRELEDSGVIQCVGTVKDEITNRHVKAYKLTGKMPTERVRANRGKTVEVKVWTSGGYTFLKQEDADRHAELYPHANVRAETRTALKA